MLRGGRFYHRCVMPVWFVEFFIKSGLSVSGASVSSKVEQLRAQLNERILVLDGGMGTMIQSYRLNEADFSW